MVAPNTNSNRRKDIHIKLGKGVQLQFDSILKSPYIAIGDWTRINGVINIRGNENCVVGKYCAFGYGIHILTTNHSVEYANVQLMLQRRHGFVELEKSKGQVVIGNNVWLGDNVTILAGSRVDDGAVIGAGSVVTSSIPAFSIAVGNPARVVRMRFNEQVIQDLLDIAWWDWSEETIKKNSHFFNTDLTTLEGSVKDLIDV